MERISQCIICLNYFGHNLCKAFNDGEGIPEEIKMNRVPHTNPYPGDQGIQWEGLFDLPEDLTPETLPRVDAPWGL